MFRMLNNACPRRYHKHILSSTEIDYRGAIAALNLLQSNEQVLADPRTCQHPVRKKSEFSTYLKKCGLETQYLEKKLSVIHVSGTKGKGSTCAYCESILRHHGYKTGFFSSPHLISVNERIRIDGLPISKEKFTSHFWEIYRKLEQYQNVENNNLGMPTYFMLLTIMAFKVFVEEKVDVVILEVGIGGEYDYTNVLSNTAVVGISSLGFDHVYLLGNTIEEISWQKGGIMKPGAIAVTASNQPTAALQVLQERAQEKESLLFIAPELNEYSCDKEIKLGIRGPVQSLNASLAIQLANAWMNPQGYLNDNFARKAPVFTLSKEILRGLSDCLWPGRTQIFRQSSSLVYCFDGAHTTESMQYCTSWFQQIVPSSTTSKRVLVFNMIGKRDASKIMEMFIPCQFDFVFFSTNRIEKVKEHVDPSSDDWSRSFENEADKSAQLHLDLWIKMNPSADGNTTKVFSSVLETHEFIEDLSHANQLHVLVTGSLHLVGAFLSVLDPELKHTSDQIRLQIQM